METVLMVATRNGINLYTRQGGAWEPLRRGLQGQQVTSVIAREGVILAGTTQGIFRSGDLGTTWQAASQGLDLPHVRWLAYHPEISDREFAGTEPAGLFVSHDGGGSWRACPEITPLRERFGWYLPYSPEAGCVRGFAFHGQRAYAAVEVGGLLVSDSAGEEWELAPGSPGKPEEEPDLASGAIHPDVHSIEVHPFSAALACAPTGGGFYRTIDGGRSWTQLYDCYCRATWLDPLTPEHILLGPAAGVDRRGRIEESHDGGFHWAPAGQGEIGPWPETMVERFVPAGEELLAVLSDGRLLSTRLDELSWQPLLPEVHDALAATILEAQG